MSLKKILSKALSNFDLYELFDHDIKILTYNELTKFKSMEDCFYPFNILFVLFETKKNFGHWCVLCQNMDNIYFFDPYGFMPDEQLKFTNKVFRKYHNMMLPYMTILLLKSDKQIHYNDHVLQDISDKSVATCGRWCSLYALLYNCVSIDEFADFFKWLGIKPDHAISLLTHYI